MSEYLVSVGLSFEADGEETRRCSSVSIRFWINIMTLGVCAGQPVRYSGRLAWDFMGPHGQRSTARDWMNSGS